MSALFFTFHCGLNLYAYGVLRCGSDSCLYIPLWLNLYRRSDTRSVMDGFLYIPFWLNLYSSITPKKLCAIMIYIPFWLNLYICRIYFTYCICNLHSILVKSILGYHGSGLYLQKNLHSILVKSILYTPETYH